MKDVKPKLRKLGDTPKPESKFCQKRKESDEIQLKILTMIDEDKADEIDLAFATLTKRIKRPLNEEGVEDLMNEINSIATCHIKSSRSKKQGIFKGCNKLQTAVCTPPPPKMQSEIRPMSPLQHIETYNFFNQNQNDALTFTELWG